MEVIVVLTYYSINKNTMYIASDNYFNTNTSIAREITGEEYVINKEANKLMAENCLRFSSNYLHRKAITKDMTNITSKPPIMIDFFGSYIYFPLFSDRNSYNLWFNIRHIKRYEKDESRTRVHFYNGEDIVVDVTYYQFDKQYSNAMKLYYKISLRREAFYRETEVNDRSLLSQRESLMLDEFKRHEYLMHMQQLDYGVY